MNQFREKSEKILCGAAFCFFIVVVTYKLTNAPLWFDETIEYWYSKIMFGKLPFDGAGIATGSSNMYQRIISTYQPPLYNVLMHFWLMIGDSEWWFRFFGVAMGFVGMIALYKTVCKIGNAYLAALAVVFSTCVYQLVYFWQECAEYCLMLGSLFWTIYFWVCLIENTGKKEIICFTISAIIPVYSQYGAVFPVAAMAISAFVYVLLHKNREQIITIVISDCIALIVAALPLYFFFLKKQMLSQHGGSEIIVQNISFTNGIIRDMLHNLKEVFKWNCFSYYNDLFIKVFLIIILLMILFVFIFSHNNKTKLLIAINLVTWILYYFSVKAKLYSYGNFGNRYNLFFIPMWIIMGFAIGIEIYSIISQYNLKNIKFEWYYTGICICFVLCFSYLGWVSKLQNNWGKENCRGAVNAWYSAGADNSNTIVYYAADSGFAYYIRQSSNFTTTIEANVNYMYWYRDRSVDEYREYVNSVFGNTWPNEIYIVASHPRDDMNVLVSSITNEGYNREDLYSQGAYLLRLTKSAGLDNSAQ